MIILDLEGSSYNLQLRLPSMAEALYISSKQPPDRPEAALHHSVAVVSNKEMRFLAYS